MKKTLLLIIASSLFIAACDSADNSADKSVPQATSTPPVVSTPEQSPVEAAAVEPVSRPAVLTAESIYNRSCVACHKTGAANAPKLGDAAAWAPRIAKGMDVLFQSALKGVPGTSMMPKGTCSACSENEIKSVVEYMVSQSK